TEFEVLAPAGAIFLNLLADVGDGAVVLDAIVGAALGVEAEAHHGAALVYDGAEAAEPCLEGTPAELALSHIGKMGLRPSLFHLFLASASEKGWRPKEKGPLLPAAPVLVRWPANSPAAPGPSIWATGALLACSSWTALSRWGATWRTRATAPP